MRAFYILSGVFFFMGSLASAHSIFVLDKTTGQRFLSLLCFGACMLTAVCCAIKVMAL